VCRIILGIIVDLPLPGGFGPTRLIRCVRAILDAFYIAQYPAHTTETLRYLRAAIDLFHENKSIFIDLGIRTHFNIPKLHSLQHYVPSIEWFGTTDNFDTAYFERLHIDWTKDAYRATNKKSNYMDQMVTWVLRREKIMRHLDFVNWR
ncbi:hypothetical protein BC834DRAFT_788454, partial [Gloeopeniophorella convolvens]